MKIRNNFVSNSSSCSFILAFKCNEKCKHCGRGDPDLADFLRSRSNNYCYSDDTELYAEGFENVLEYVRNDLSEYVSDREDFISDIEKQIGEVMAEHSDWNFIACSVSYHDEITNDMIREKSENGSLIKIWSDHE